MGLTQVTLPVALPPTTVAVKVYEAQGPPVEGGEAETSAVVGPIAAALTRVGAVRPGITRAAGAERGVVDPSVRVPTAVMVYVSSGVRPVSRQLVASLHVKVSGALLPVAVTERV